MTDIKQVYNWVYDNAARAIDKKRQDGTIPIVEDVIIQEFTNWVNLARLYHSFSDIEFDNTKDIVDHLVHRYQTQESYLKPAGFCYQDDSVQPWLSKRRTDIDWFYWKRYRQYLASTKHWGHNIIQSMDEDTDKILDCLADPLTLDSFDRRGLVVASVQSGKTSNYIGLIAKAADAGYRIIIILAGIYNVLRNQTQERVEEGFVGYDMVKKAPVGVGLGSSSRRPLPGTSRLRDFNKPTVEAFLGLDSAHYQEPLVFVIKKNAHSLKEITLWLESNNRKKNGPLLLIDDEADNASINVAYSKGDVSRINGQIRKILSMFSQSAYVGYTATPFANVLIDSRAMDDEVGADIFPRNFIYTLEQSNEYFGAEKVFGDIDSVSPRYLRWIPKYEENRGNKLRSSDCLTELPRSLKDAIDTFVIACAIRVLSGDADQHMTMMINLSPYKSVQHSTYFLVKDYMDQLRMAIHSFANLRADLATEENPLLCKLRDTWQKEYADEGFTWREVLSVLSETISPMTLAEINSQSGDALDYTQDAQRVIAIGGYRLSRGLTLEGLLVSYYDRNAKAYDSLMQMARWFGYRPDYEQLCRIWMTEQSADWYAYVARATRELTDEVRTMRSAHSTPREYGLRIQSSPDALMITARNKMGAGKEVEAKVRFDGQLVETTAFDRDAETLVHNEQVAIQLLKNLAAHHYYPDATYPNAGEGKLIRDVPDGLIRDYLSEYCNSPSSPQSAPESILRHIDILESKGVDRWDVYVAPGSSKDCTFPVFDKVIAREQRKPGIGTSIETFKAHKGRLAGRGIEKMGLDEQQIALAERKFKLDHPDKNNIADRYYRMVPGRKPVLILHPLTLRFASAEQYDTCCQHQPDLPTVWISADHHEETVGWSISFPEMGIKEEVPYVFNDVMLDQLRNGLDEEIGDDAPDE